MKKKTTPEFSKIVLSIFKVPDLKSRRDKFGHIEKGLPNTKIEYQYHCELIWDHVHKDESISVSGLAFQLSYFTRTTEHLDDAFDIYCEKGALECWRWLSDNKIGRFLPNGKYSH